MSTDDHFEDDVPQEVACAENTDSVSVDPSAYRSEVMRIGDSRAVAIRCLSSLGVLDEVSRRNSELLEKLQSEEDNMFSPIPDYIFDSLKTQTATNSESYGVAVSKCECHSTLDNKIDFSQEQRAFVDPSVPLPLPFDFRKKRASQTNARGTYHNLFFGDGSEYTFDPPENNRRSQIEERKRLEFKPPKSHPISYEPPARNVLRVSRDFVPACASPSYSPVRN